MPRVSVITPCYNAERFILEVVDSVERQTYTSWEHIVVDDGSTDSSAQLVESRAAASDRLRLLRQSNAGVSRARNAGAAACAPDSEYLLFLDADDRLKPTMLEEMVRYLDRHPGVGLAYSLYELIDEHGQSLPDEHHVHPPRVEPTRFGLRRIPDDEPKTPLYALLRTMILPSAALIRRSVYEQTPGFDEELGQPKEDTDLYLHIGLRSEIHQVPLRLVEYRRHEGQSTADRQRVQIQDRKLRAKWEDMEGLDKEHLRRVRKMWHYWRGRTLPRIWLSAGTAALRRGNPARALLLYLGAGYRYAASFLPVQTRRASSSDSDEGSGVQ